MNRQPLSNFSLCRDNLRISFIALIYAVLGIVNTSAHWRVYWQMSHTMQLIGYIAGIILMTAGTIYALIFLFMGVVESINRSKLSTLLPQMGGVFLDLLFLMLNIPVLNTMSGILFDGDTGSSFNLGLPVTLAVIAICNLAANVWLLRKVKDTGFEIGGKYSPYVLFRDEDAKSKSNSVAPQPVKKRVAFCPHCGSPVKEGDQFCGTCGKELPKEAE